MKDGIEEIKIRKAKLTDLKQITDLAIALWRHHEMIDDKIYLPVKNLKSVTHSYLRKSIYSKKHFLTVAEKDNMVIGYILASISLKPPVFLEREMGYIFDAFIKKEYRGKGILKKLLNPVYEWFGKNKINFLELSVDIRNTGGVKAWEREGFKTVRLRKYKKI